MKKKKIVKREVKSKNKFLGLAVLLVLVAFSLVGVTRILGQSTAGVLQVCETNGGVLMVKDKCPGGAPFITLGVVEGGAGTVIGGNAIGSGYARFIDRNQILTSDGLVMQYIEVDSDNDGAYDSGVWEQIESIHQLDNSIVDTISYWSQRHFVTKNGDFYVLREFAATNSEERYDEWAKTTAFPTN